MNILNNRLSFLPRSLARGTQGCIINRGYTTVHVEAL